MSAELFEVELSIERCFTDDDGEVMDSKSLGHEVLGSFDTEEEAEALKAALMSGGYKAAALDAIHRLMDGTEWDSETTSAIGEILTDNGYTIRDPNDLDPEALDEAVHDAKGEEAAEINNQGTEAQRAYLEGGEE